nr:methyltransferase [Indioceanicola profundi]
MSAVSGAFALALGAGTALTVAGTPTAQAHEHEVHDAHNPGERGAVAAAIGAAMAGDHRSEANRARDRFRNPRATLLFFGLKPDMTVMEIWPGGGGWYTEVLAPVLDEKGQLVAANFDQEAEGFAARANAAFAAKLAERPDIYDRVRVTEFSRDDLAPIEPGTADMVLTFRNVHNWMAAGWLDEAMAAMYNSLRPGGVLGLVEHRAPDTEPQDPQAASGYVRQDYVIAAAERAGFRFAGASEINANPRDTKDHPRGVWTLPPTLRLGEERRNEFLAIGESDRMTLRFVRPE